jgi:hypothetical protein
MAQQRRLERVATVRPLITIRITQSFIYVAHLVYVLALMPAMCKNMCKKAQLRTLPPRDMLAWQCPEQVNLNMYSTVRIKFKNRELLDVNEVSGLSHAHER